MSDENKQGDDATKSELSDEALETVAGGTNAVGSIIRRTFRAAEGGPAGPTGQTPGQQATEGMTPSQIASTKPA